MLFYISLEEEHSYSENLLEFCELKNYETVFVCFRTITTYPQNKSCRNTV